MRNLILLLLSYIILTTYAFSNSVSEYISNLIPGEGDTEVSIDLRENYSPDYAGAVSVFVNSVSKISKYKNNITIFGSTDYKKKLSNNYHNINLSKKFLSSQSKLYVNKFLEIQKKYYGCIIL